MNQKINEIIDYLEQEAGYDRGEIISDILSEMPDLKGHSPDEVGLEWGDEHLTDLGSFSDEYYRGIIEKVCNVLKSFKEKETNQ